MKRTGQEMKYDEEQAACFVNKIHLTTTPAPAHYQRPEIRSTSLLRCTALNLINLPLLLKTNNRQAL